MYDEDRFQGAEVSMKGSHETIKYYFQLGIPVRGQAAKQLQPSVEEKRDGPQVPL